VTLHADLRRLERHYDELVRRHGRAPEGAQWTSVESQRRRFAALAEVGDLSGAKVLDFGCGTGALLDYLTDTGFHGEYVGIDLSETAVSTAADAHPGTRFERRDILAEGLDERFDYVLMSGIFNNLVSDNWALLDALTRPLLAAADRAIAFNMLSTYVDYTDDGLWYADPGAVFAWCKTELSPAVTLRHDYEIRDGVVPFEYTVYVRRSAAAPRPNRTP
jgi:cyclopropane fatty-acyl-phospholipid synthase-like methyltransferase